MKNGSRPSRLLEKINKMQFDCAARSDPFNARRNALHLFFSSAKVGQRQKNGSRSSHVLIHHHLTALNQANSFLLLTQFPEHNSIGQSHSTAIFDEQRSPSSVDQPQHRINLPKEKRRLQQNHKTKQNKTQTRAMSWFSSQWNRWANGPNGPSRSGHGGGGGADGPIRRIEVIWGRER